MFVLAIELDFVGLLRNIRTCSIDEYMKYEHTCIHEQYICLYDGSSSHHGAMQIRTVELDYLLFMLKSTVYAEML